MVLLCIYLLGVSVYVGVFFGSSYYGGFIIYFGI